MAFSVFTSKPEPKWKIWQSNCNGQPNSYNFGIKESGGQHQMESAYPYTAQDGTCSASDAGFYDGGVMKSSISYWGTNEDDLKALLVEHGPVVTGKTL